MCTDSPLSRFDLAPSQHVSAVTGTMASAMDLTALEKDPRLFLYTSLTAGSSHIITATSRMETILKANKIPFQAIDIATDEKARRLWQRRAGKRKIPGLVKEGYVVGVCACRSEAAGPQTKNVAGSLIQRLRILQRSRNGTSSAN